MIQLDLKHSNHLQHKINLFHKAIRMMFPHYLEGVQKVLHLRQVLKIYRPLDKRVLSQIIRLIRLIIQFLFLVSNLRILIAVPEVSLVRDGKVDKRLTTLLLHLP